MANHEVERRRTYAVLFEGLQRVVSQQLRKATVSY